MEVTIIQVTTTGYTYNNNQSYFLGTCSYVVGK